MLKHIAAAAAIALPASFATPALSQEVVSIDTAVDAAVAAGLVETLMSGAEYTVFMPTNDALSAVPQDALASVVADPASLAATIQGYVVEGSVRAADAVSMIEDGGGEAMATALDGSSLTLTSMNGTVMVNGAEIIVPNLAYGPLTVHVISGAYLPGS
jgi:uncharacterized surface protein with fasciclin (FAS1) repeats